MQFLIADTFTTSLARLPNEQQRAAKTTAFDLQTNLAHPGLSLHRLAKGLEYRAVVVMACDSEVIPLQSRVESIADEAHLEEVYNTERNLLYVACTRARDHLLVTGVEPASEFLDDLQM